MYKLIALDMDGTLFNSDKQITDRTKETLAQARALGVKLSSLLVDHLLDFNHHFKN